MSLSVVIRALLVLALAANGAQAQEAVRLRLHGSNTIGQRLAPALVEAWAQQRGWTVGARSATAAEEVAFALERPAGRIEVEIHSHGTGTGNASLVAGRADLWMASRPVKREEIEAAAALGRLDDAAQEHVIALDGLTIIVHGRNPVGTVTVAQLRDVFAGRIRDWAQLGGTSGAIALYARDDKSGTFDSFKTMVLGDAALASSARRFESTDALAQAVAADARGIGFVGLAGAGGSGIKVLTVADAGTRALAPTRLDIGTEDYVLSRRLFLYNGARVTPLTRDFLEFVLAPAGQRVVERIGFVSLDIQPFDVAARRDVSPEYLDLTRGARRLSLNFRFGSGLAYLDNRALRDLGRLAGYMADAARADLDLLLLGFVDGRETNPYVAISLANDRVDFVARMLAERGVGARRVRGMGAVAPVASNDTETGRARNRRVEVWVKPRAAAGAVLAESGLATR